MYSQKSSAETNKIRDLVKTSVKDEENLKVRYEELENKEKELMTQLDAVQKEKAEVAEQKTEKSKQIKDLTSLEEEKAVHRMKEECLMRITIPS
uniref:Putative ovule protein n=1 Tax=Solanum chacoense TaxID=4108 RepID=A0A0V0GYH8_SOLCH